VDAHFKWDKATDNVNVAGYSIERSENQTDWQYLSQNITGTTYTDPGLSKSVPTYYYRLRSIDAAGNFSEGVFANVDMNPNSNSASQPGITAPAKSNKHTVLKTGGILLLLLAFAGGLIRWLRWRAAKTASLDEQIRVESFEHSLQNPQPPQPHQSESLTDMVMEDFHSGNTHPKPPKDKA
jgi:hypothetical protein